MPETLSWSRAADRLHGANDQLAKGHGGAILLEGPAREWMELLRRLSSAPGMLSMAYQAEARDTPGHHALRLWASLSHALVHDADAELIRALTPERPKGVEDADADWHQRFLEQIGEERLRAADSDTINVTAPQARTLRLWLQLAERCVDARPTRIALLNLGSVLSPSLWALVSRLADGATAERPLLLLCAAGEDPLAGYGGPGPARWLEEIAWTERWRLERPTAADLAPIAGDHDLAQEAADGMGPWLVEHGLFDREVADEALILAREQVAQGLDWSAVLQTAPTDLLDALPPPEDGGLDREQRDRLLWLAAQEGREFTARALARALELDPDVVDDCLDSLAPAVQELRHLPRLSSWRYRFRHRLRLQLSAALHVDGGKEARSALLGILCRDFLPGDFGLMPTCLRLSSELGDKHRFERLAEIALGSDPPGFLEDAMEMLAGAGPRAGLRARVGGQMARHIATRVHPTESPARLDGLASWAEEVGEPEVQARAWMAQAQVSAHARNFPKATEQMNRAREVFRRRRMRSEEAECVLEQAAMLASSGEAKKAKALLQEARGLSAAPKLKARAAYLRGVMARLQRQGPEAAEHFAEAYNTARDTEGYAIALESVAGAAQALVAEKELDRALTMLADGALLARAVGHTPRQVALLHLAAQVHSIRNEFETARSLADEALGAAQEDASATGRTAHDDAVMRHALLQAGLFAAQSGDMSNAIELLEQATEGARTAQDQRVLADSLLALGQALAAAGRPEDGLGRLEELLGILDDPQRRTVVKQTIERLRSI
jgi:tetratricopeptide (TPR) repeat protein